MLQKSYFVLALAALLNLGCNRFRTTADSLEAVVVREDWPAVAARTSRGTSGPAPLRLVRAHALLAMNRNNESVCLFSELSPEDLRQWDAWTHAFVEAHPRTTVAHYLRGDALARLGQPTVALAAFDRALQADSNHVLSLNARAVVRAAEQDWNGALADLHRANRINASFADGHATRGFIYIHKKGAAEGALRAFESALRLSPEFALAGAGKAYAQLVLGRWDEGTRDLETSGRRSACAATLLAVNAVQIAEWVDKLSGAQVAELRGQPPGTQLDRALSDLRSGKVDAAKPVARILGENPQYAPRVRQTMEQIRQENPKLFDKIGQTINKGAEWTKPNGGADTVLRGAKGLGGSKFEPLLNQQLDKTRTDNNGWLTMERMTKGQSVPGGATTSLQTAFYDQGDWPFLPHYGLLYPVKQQGDVR